MTKKSRKTFKYLDNEKSIKNTDETKTIFHQVFHLPKILSDLKLLLWIVTKIRNIIASVKRSGGKPAYWFWHILVALLLDIQYNYKANLFQKFHFPIEVVFNSL